MDFSAIRSRLASSEGRLYWRSIGELADTPEFREYLHREFPEQASEWNDPKGRRAFLKLMSASLALAGVGACTKQPPETIVPYVRQPEDVVPGRPLFFASAIPFDGFAQPVLVESHMGRPTKIEGNPEHPASLGATDAITQAAVLGLYDPDRAKTVVFRGEVRTWGAFISEVQGLLAAQKGTAGGGLRFLTGTITSPSLAELMASILRDYPQAKWHQYEPVTRDGARLGLHQAAGSAAHPIYHFDRADVIVSLDADFLGCGPGNVRHQKDFSGRRRVADDRKEMNRLYAIESTPTLTGAKADHRLSVRASEIENIARELQAAMGGSTGSPQPSASVPRPGEPEIAKWVGAIANDLQAHRGRSVVVAGEYQPAAVHAIAHAINQSLGNAGTTVTYGATVEAVPTNQLASLRELVAAIDANQVEVLVILDGNPVFTAPADLKFAEKLTKISRVVYHGLYNDETAHLSHWNVPAAHPLETWYDGRAYDGTVTMTQPLIAPLYEGRSAHELLAAFTPQPERRTHDLVKEYWTRAFGGGSGWTIRDASGQPFKTADAFWRRMLHDGFVRGTAIAEGGPATPFVAPPRTPSVPATAATTPAGPATPTAASPATPSAVPPSAASAERRAPSAAPTSPASAEPRAPSAAPTNPASAEPRAPSAAPLAPPIPQPPDQGGLEIIFRPDPSIWDGRYANNGWLQELPKPFTKLTWDTTAWVSYPLARERDLHNGDVIELRYRGNTVRMPVFIVPGHPRNSVTVFFGYGRRLSGRVGTASNEAQQFNAYLLRTSDAPWFGSGLEIAKTGERYLLASTQEHHAMEERHPIRIASLEQYKHEPAVIAHMAHTPPRTLTMYPEHRYDGYKWGMAIDLTTCTGCSACVVACVAENNIPVVGKDQVERGREMQWLRVDHYYEGNPDDAQTVQSYHQPVPCMQCETAPCEVVCPVAATSHSSEGLNDMTYNRCVGTRYCSNNCPYKVRRFNFLLYSDWDTSSLHPLRNPDVSVRSRGVMEKCTYCVQRINQARVDAKREERSIRDGEVMTACQAVCPSDAIVFGDLNDPESRVSKLKKQERNYGMLEDLNTRPRTSYLAALRNPNPELEPAQAATPGAKH